MIQRRKGNNNSLWRHFRRNPLWGLLVILILAQGWQWGERRSASDADLAIDSNALWILERTHDGDTVTLRSKDGEQKEKLRFFALDAPELAQPGGPEAKEFLQNLLGGRNITVESYGRDQYGRLLARLWVDGQAVDDALISAGHAWVYRRHCDHDFCAVLEASEEEARTGKRGLWGDDEGEPVPPWIWRRRN